MAGPVYAVRLSRGAEEDLEALSDHVAQHRPAGEAAALLDAILEEVGTLERFPHRGAVPDELAGLGLRNFRQRLVPPCRLIWRVIGNEVFVLAIAETRRDMQALLERRLLGR